MTETHGLFKSLIFINSFLPPHGPQTSNPTPKSRWHSWNLFFINFADSIIIGININDKTFVNFFLDMRDDLIIDNGLESESGLFLFKNFINNVWNNLFTKVQIDEPCRWKPYTVIGVRILELNLMMVKQARRFILTPDINHNITLIKNFRIAAPHYSRILELGCIISEHSTSQGLITMKTTIMRTNFHVFEQVSKDILKI